MVAGAANLGNSYTKLQASRSVNGCFQHFKHGTCFSNNISETESKKDQLLKILANDTQN